MNEVQDIFIEHSMEYMKNHKLPSHILRVMGAVKNCRTAKLGGHVDKCDACGHIRVSYNSCRNRHCPKCQTLAKEKWLNDRKKDLLEVGYFHVVFTIPEELNYITLLNQKEVYSILFKSVSGTLLELGRDKKYLGAETGFLSILHTWGQNLMNHPHIHCIVPGGGLSFDGMRWINSRKKFFIPVEVLSRKFRGKFLSYFKRAYYDNKLKLPPDTDALTEKYLFQCLVDKLYEKEWIVYCKAPFKSAAYVLEYLGRYTHRVAISNNRIANYENGYVTFKWRDYKDGNKEKYMTVTAQEFIRRFLMHILPKQFVKIRHYGILSNRSRSTKLKRCKLLTGSNLNDIPEVKLSTEEMISKLIGIDISLCPCCGTGRMVKKDRLLPKNYSPPGDTVKTA